MPPEAGPKDMLWLPPHDHIKPFDGTNYDGWAPPVRALLEAHSTWSIICGKRTRPTPPVAKLEWSQDDEKGAGIILWNCAPSIQQELISAQEQGDGEYGSYQSLGRYRWEYLKKMYKSDVEAMSTLEAFKRHRELFSYRAHGSHCPQIPLSRLSSTPSRNPIPTYLRGMSFRSERITPWTTSGSRS
ncbi:hypothetical protein AX16_001516 [Volvariella volvacea WC 439]|nr:hypothetical protein AX16_001516 [Volvariella volvacea WC 439]